MNTNATTSTNSDATAATTGIKKEAVEPLYLPWEVPNKHRVKPKRDGDKAEVVNGRRASPVPKVNALRRAVSDWREAYYPGASDTSRASSTARVSSASRNRPRPTPW